MTTNVTFGRGRTLHSGKGPAQRFPAGSTHDINDTTLRALRDAGADITTNDPRETEDTSNTTQMPKRAPRRDRVPAGDQVPSEESARTDDGAALDAPASRD